MTEYNVEKQVCEKCKKINFCIQIEDKKKGLIWLCDNDFSWSINYQAEVKDKIRAIMIEQGIEDLDISV